MTKKILLVRLFFLISLSFFAQNNEKLIFGKVKDSSGVVKNANIINLRSTKGTFTNDNGEFKMIAALGDSLRISSIQDVTAFIVVNQFSLDNEKIDIFLKSAVQVLEPFEIKRNQLLGILGIDGKFVPKNIKDSLLQKTMDFSDVVWSSWDGPDEIDKKVKPPLVRTDPNLAFIGAGASIGIPFKSSEKYWALIKNLSFKESFPTKLFVEFGAKFFLVDLKIPPENYYHFLEYCNPLGIEQLYKDNQKLEVLKILREQSLSYIKIITLEKE